MLGTDSLLITGPSVIEKRVLPDSTLPSLEVWW
jgi:hypothetical protein